MLTVTPLSSIFNPPKRLEFRTLRNEKRPCSNLRTLLKILDCAGEGEQSRFRTALPHKISPIQPTSHVFDKFDTLLVEVTSFFSENETDFIRLVGPLIYGAINM